VFFFHFSKSSAAVTRALHMCMLARHDCSTPTADDHGPPATKSHAKFFFTAATLTRALQVLTIMKFRNESMHLHHSYDKHIYVYLHTASQVHGQSARPHTWFWKRLLEWIVLWPYDILFFVFVVDVGEKSKDDVLGWEEMDRQVLDSAAFHSPGAHVPSRPKILCFVCTWVRR
jgi:hypothetical protein